MAIIYFCNIFSASLSFPVSDFIVKHKTEEQQKPFLGYYKDFDKTTYEYRKDYEGYLFEIDFWLEDKTISKNQFRDMGYITMQELQAINKKCKELGWLDE